MGAVAYIGLSFFAPFLDTTSLVGILLQGTFAGILAIIVGIGVLLLLKNKELVEVWQTIHHKFWRAKIIATDPEIV